MPDLTPDRSLRRPPPPGAHQVIVRAGRRRRHTALAAGALAAAALVAVPVAALSLPGPDRDRLLADDPPSQESSPAPSPPAAQSCPASLRPDDQALPAPPPPQLAGALVPEEVPLAVTICRYGDIQHTGGGQSPSRPDEVPLDGERSVTGGLEQLPHDLAVPAGDGGGPCTAMGGAVIPYLVQLRYQASTVWLRTTAEPNSCTGVTNGTFRSPVYVGGQVAASFEAGTWVPAPPRGNVPAPAECPLPPTGRAGQERELVPEGWTGLVVCRSPEGRGQTAHPVDAERARDAAALLNSLPARAVAGFSASCDGRQQVAGDDGAQLLLLFSYPAGRAVTVVPFVGCDPPVSNGSLAATATPDQQAELLRLLRRA